MKKLNFKLLLCIAIPFIGSRSLAQEEPNSNSNETIEVSSDLFSKIKDWQQVWSDQKIPLDDYLARIKNDEELEKIDQIIKRLKNQEKKSDCNCITVTVNSSHDIAPASGGEYYPPENQGGLTTWARKDVNGAATNQALSLNSFDGNTDYEYSNEINANSGTSTAYSRMSFNYLCTNGALLPLDCGCDKTIYLKTGYYGKGSVDTKLKGILNNRKAQGVVEDATVLFKIDQYQANADVSVLKAGTLQVYRSQHEIWNPQAWINYGTLAASVTGAVVAVVGGAPIPPLGNIATQIATAANTPVTLQLGSEDSDGVAEKDFAVQYDGGHLLKPNHIVTLQMISRGYIFAKGKRKYKVYNKRFSDYFMSAVIPFNNANPECCIEKYAKWVSASMGVIGNYALRNSVGSHVTLWNPWSNLSDSDGDGNININQPIGFGVNNKQCITCGDPISGLSVNAGNLNLNSTTTRPVHFSWQDQMFVDIYTVYVYNENGLLVTTQDTTSNSTIINLPPGNYTFKVRAKCKNGNIVFSNLFDFNVPKLFMIAEEHLAKNKVLVYPNPTDGIINIEKVDDKISIKSLKILDLNNIEIFTVQLEESNLQKVDLSSLTKGVYIVEIDTNNGVLLDKIVKN
jgi:hypothetical protein